jgi:hypothetical protein
MQPFLYTSLYQLLAKRVGGGIMGIDIMGLGLFINYHHCKEALCKLCFFVEKI